MTTTNFLPTFSNDSDSDLISQNSHSRRNGMEKEVEKIRDFFYLPDLTLLEKKMLEDWIDFVSSLSPPDYAEQWLGIQGTIRKILARKKNQGENLETFKQTKSGQDHKGQPVSGRMMYRTLDWRTWETLQIPLTENCNLLCRHCTRTRKFIEKDISHSEFKVNLAKFSPYQFENLLLSDFGEPFLRKDLLNILRYVKSQGFERVEVVTTGNLIREKIRRAIVEEQLLNRILISIEGASKALYEDIRGSDFEEMKFCIKSLINYRNQINMDGPKIIFNVVCLKENIHELPGIMDLAYELGVDEVYFVHLSGIVSEMSDSERKRLEGKLLFTENHLNSCENNLVLDIFRKIEAKSKHYNIPFKPPENYFGNAKIMPEKKFSEDLRCNKPYEWVQVNNEGNVFPCCQIAQRYSVGSIVDKTFEDIWNEEEYKIFREGLENGNPNPWCQSCNIYNGKRF